MGAASTSYRPRPPPRLHRPRRMQSLARSRSCTRSRATSCASDATTTTTSCSTTCSCRGTTPSSTRAERAFQIVDLGSHNGTFVNGRRIDRSPSAAGDLIAIGVAPVPRPRRQSRGVQRRGAVGFAAVELSVVTDWPELVDDVSFALDAVALPRRRRAVRSRASRRCCGALTGCRPGRRRRRLLRRAAISTPSTPRCGVGSGWCRRTTSCSSISPSVHRWATPPSCASLPTSRAERAPARVEEVMAQLGLDHRRDTVINSLSGGQRKRVSVATRAADPARAAVPRRADVGARPGLRAQPSCSCCATSPTAVARSCA